MIRAFKIQDLEEVLEIWLQTNKEAHYFIPESYWIENKMYVREALPQSEVYVEEQEGKIIGFIGLDKHYIAGLFVRFDQQGMGVGSRLLKHVMLQKDRLQLNVYTENKEAIGFYQKHGFKEVERKIESHTGAEEIHMTWHVIKEE